MRRLTVALLVLIIVPACRNETQTRNVGGNGTTRTATSGTSTSSTTVTMSIAESCNDQSTPTVTTVAVTDTVHGPWERPMTLESAGTDPVIPCACVTIHPNTRNDTTDEAFQNLIDAADTANQAGTQPTSAVIVGHGENGGLCTGNGEMCSDKAGNKMMGSTINDWSAKASTLKQSGVTTLRILGCGVGAGAIGKKFVHDIANATGLIVLAPNCLLHCDVGKNVSLVQGGSWYDSRTPLPEPPKPSALPLFVPVKIGATFQDISWDSVITADFRSLANPLSAPFKNNDKERLFAGQIGFDHAFHITGEPFGIITDSVTLSFKSNSPKTYLIYGNVAARDPDDPSKFYPVSPWLSDQMVNQH